MVMEQIWNGPADYRIKVKGRLESGWSDWFEGMSLESDRGFTTMTGEVLDQAGLHGILVLIRDLGLPLISVERIIDE